MFRFGIRTILILVAFCCIGAAGISYLLSALRPLQPTYYAQFLDVDPETYLHLEDLNFTEFGFRIYAYEQNQFVNAIHGTDKWPQLADEHGHVPALKFDGDTFIHHLAKMGQRIGWTGNIRRQAIRHQAGEI